MPRLLLNRATGALLPYPREDNEPVVGLDRDAAYVVEVEREPEPEPEYDSATHYLQPLQPVIAITDPEVAIGMAQLATTYNMPLDLIRSLGAPDP